MKNKYGKRPPQCVVREEGERQNARGTMLNAKHHNEGDDGPNKLDSRQRQRNAASDAPIGEEDSSVNDLHETDYRSARRVLTQSHNVASQWRRGERARNWTEAESRRLLHSPG